MTQEPSKNTLDDYDIPVEPVADLVNRLYATAQQNQDADDPVSIAIKTLSMEIGMELTKMIPKEAIKLLEGYDPSLEGQIDTL